VEIGSIAASFIAAQVAELQTTMAAKMVKMNADQGANAAKLLQAAQDNMKSLSNVAAGVGQNLNITV
jgi:hypothetical protein